jgi:sec-independent protein translocase protein TatB
MFGIGMPEMILILAIALIVIGPKKLPDLAKSLGKAMGEFKKATRDLKDSMQIDSDIDDLKTAFKDINREEKYEPKMPPSDAEDPPADDGEPDETPADGPEQDAIDPMDQVKTAFDRHHAESEDADAVAGDASAAPATEADEGATTRKE